MFKSFLKDETGAELAEYAVAVALLVAIAAVVYAVLGDAIWVRTTKRLPQSVTLPTPHRKVSPQVERGRRSAPSHFPRHHGGTRENIKRLEEFRKRRTGS